MDSESLKWTLTLSGAAAELVGLALVVWDVRDARRAARDALNAYEPDPMTYPVSASFTAQYDVHGVQPPLAERVENLERRLADQHAAALSRVNTLRDELREEVFTRMRAVLEQADERERRLRGFLSDQLDSGIGRRIAGTVLFMLGVGLSAVSNLV
ncbi:MAG TPA: hypothetical protein VK501_03295 [Baekduia sp.]|uniref:hypothetical protein n=1 Tax=Baekduia sp. TaxID=2600305 RepID=UPI002CBEEFD6|nr:hypothetical protein [Baekduia sp.]HMJ32919.1 hypothetical protein [Baekduia sp.]